MAYLVGLYAQDQSGRYGVPIREDRIRHVLSGIEVTDQCRMTDDDHSRESQTGAEDQFLWLEDVDGDDALDWVRRHNDPTMAELWH